MKPFTTGIGDKSVEYFFDQSSGGIHSPLAGAIRKHRSFQSFWSLNAQADDEEIFNRQLPA